LACASYGVAVRCSPHHGPCQCARESTKPVALRRARDFAVSQLTQPPPESPAVPNSQTSKEQHVMWLDRQQVYLSWGGLASGFIIAVVCLVVSAVVISRNHDVAGTILGTVDLAALVAVFVARRK
jgi:hypothetical protein